MKPIKIITLICVTMCLASCTSPADDETPATQEFFTISSSPQPTFALPFLSDRFTAVDIYGNLVADHITPQLLDKEVYFIHLWGTWCPPCVREMPDLAELYHEYSDRVGFIGLLDDFDSNKAGAVKILENAGIPETFVMLDAHEESLAPLLEAVNSGSFPTTVMLSEDGFSEQIIGVGGARYAQAIDELLSR
jgi:thiol-disulfide isomerase/thioredoxin